MTSYVKKPLSIGKKTGTTIENTFVSYRKNLRVPGPCKDPVVLATLHRLLKPMLDISFRYSLKWHFKFQSVKACVVLFSKQNVKSNTIFMLDDQPLKNEGCASQLGIRDDSNLE